MKLHWFSDDTQSIEDGAPTTADLDRVGVLHQTMPADPDTFQPQLDVLKADKGYVEQDIVELSPETENLDASTRD